MLTGKERNVREKRRVLDEKDGSCCPFPDHSKHSLTSCLLSFPPSHLLASSTCASEEGRMGWKRLNDQREKREVYREEKILARSKRLIGRRRELESEKNRRVTRGTLFIQDIREEINY